MYTTGNHIEIKKRQYLFHSWLEKWLIGVLSKAGHLKLRYAVQSNYSAFKMIKKSIVKIQD